MYHDITYEDYNEEIHKRMTEEESKRWNQFKNFFAKKEPLNILDIGTGAGFVPLTISPFLKQEDTLICADISKKMLFLARKNLENRNFKCNFKYAKISKKLPFSKNSIDIITINSTLHHIEDITYFLSEIDKVLKDGGLLIIGHEDNKRFHQNMLMRYSIYTLEFLFFPEEALRKMIRVFKIEKMFNKIYNSLPSQKKITEKRKGIAKKINEDLIKQNLISEKLSYEQIMKIVDIRSIEGIDPLNLKSEYKILCLQTYNVMPNPRIRKIYFYNKFVSRYFKYLEKKYKFDGTDFFLILKKTR